LSSDIYQAYCKQRNIVQKLCNKAKADYFNNQTELHKNDPKKLWKQFKKLGYQQKSKSDSKMVLSVNNENCHDDKLIANHFNSFFTTIASKLVEKLPSSTGRFSTQSDCVKNFYAKRRLSNERMFLKHVSEDFVQKELCNLKVSKSTGLDGIPARFLKDAAHIIKMPITFIINMSISEGSVPCELKSAKVKPLYKKNNRLHAENYRPISILSIVSKILEKAVYQQLEKHLTSNNLFYELQSGFRGAFSTDTCLIHLTDHIKSKIANGLYTGMILLDLQKAFDTVDHRILLDKLSLVGVGSLPWFRSYLSNRTQLVTVNGIQSDICPITCGVPQGSLLGPLLFLVYCNDLQCSIDSDCNVLLYADDTAITFSSKNPEVIARKLSKMLKSCQEWLTDNKLSLHLGKTESILFGTKRKIQNLDQNYVIKCNDHTIKRSDTVKYLGVFLDSNLSGDAMVNHIIKKANQKLKFLYRYQSCLSQKSRKQLCVSLIQCHIDYSCPAWYESLSNRLKNKLQVVQNRIVRFILSLHHRHRITNVELHKVGFLNVSNRVKQLRLNHVHNIFHERSPIYLRHNFVKQSSRYNTRSGSSNFKIPHIKGIEATTFFYSGIIDWNLLPESIKSNPKKFRFKREVKKHLALESAITENSDYIY
jgi:hypothetical protein